MKRWLFSVVILVWVAAMGTAFAAESVTVRVRGMVCGFCAQGIQKKFSKEAAVSSVTVSLEEKIVRLTMKDGQTVSDETIRAILQDAGYDVSDIERKP